MVSPMPSYRSVPSPTALRTLPARAVPASVMPRWEWIGHQCCHSAVGFDGRVDVEGLQGYLDQVEVKVLEDRYLPQPGLNHVVDDRVVAGLGFGRLGKLVDVVGNPGESADLTYTVDGRQATEVNADTDGYLAGLRLANDGLDLAFVADVAGVQPQAVNAAVEGLEGKLVVEVDVGHDGDVDLALDPSQRLGRLHVGDGAPDYLAPLLLQPTYLGDRGRDVAGVGLGHRLDSHGRIAADLHVADVQSLRHPPLVHLAPSDRSSFELYQYSRNGCHSNLSLTTDSSTGAGPFRSSCRRFRFPHSSLVKPPPMYRRSRSSDAGCPSGCSN